MRKKTSAIAAELLIMQKALITFATYPPGTTAVGGGVSLSLVIGDDDVIEDGATLRLPKIQANETKQIKRVDGVVIDELWIVDLLGVPGLVLWVMWPASSCMACEDEALLIWT